MFSNPKKWIPMLFAIKSSFGQAQWSWPRNERLVKNDVTSGISQSALFLFCLLDVRIALPTSICLFFVEENSSALLKQQFPELDGFCDSWRDITTHSETQTLFCTDTRSSSLGVAKAGELKIDLRALKCQHPIFFLRIPFYTSQTSTVPYVFIAHFE